MPDGIPVNFTQAADKAGGLISPVFKADVLSRLDGPVDGRALPGFLAGPPDLAAAFDGATILGMPLAALVESIDLPKPLAIVATPDGGASMTWKDLRLRSSGPFVAHPGTTFELTVVRSPAETVTRCTITDFTLVLPPGLGDLVRIHFQTLRFEQRPGRSPALDVEGLGLELGGDLGLLKTLQDAVDFGDNAPALRPLPNGLHAGYTLAIPETSAGAFVMRNIAVGVGVDVPFDGQPIVTSLSFASREDPFNLSVSAFGGGGYLVFEIAQDGIRKLEASLDFGATVAIGIGVATAEVHALGGVRFLLQGDRVAVTGFLRVGGSVDVLGLVSVSVELRIELTYIEGVLKGRATAVIEIDVTFWSGSIELDSGEYTFAGAEAGPGRTRSIRRAGFVRPAGADAGGLAALPRTVRRVVSELLLIPVPGTLPGGAPVVRVVVVPKLDPAAAVSASELGDWPTRLAAATFELEVASGAVAATVAHEASTDTWQALLGTLPVEAAAAPAIGDPPVVRSTSTEAASVEGSYRATAGTDLDIDAANTAPLGVEAARQLRANWAGAEPAAPVGQAAAATASADEFHRVIAVLREHPAVMRRLGLIFDLVPDATAQLGTSGTVRVRWPTKPDDLPPVSSPRASYEVHAERVWCRAAASSCAPVSSTSATSRDGRPRRSTSTTPSPACAMRRPRCRPLPMPARSRPSTGPCGSRRCARPGSCCCAAAVSTTSCGAETSPPTTRRVHRWRMPSRSTPKR